MMPLVSVVIPHFQRSRLLRGAIDSVLRASPNKAEIVVVDDGSSEDEWQRILAYSSDNVIVMQRQGGPKGPSRCRNLGVAASHGKYVMFLDSDDLMAPWCIEQRLTHASNSPDAPFWVFPVLLFRDAPGDKNTLWGDMGDGVCGAERFAYGAPPWHTSSPLWTRAAMASVSGFNESVLYGDDSDLHFRALVSGMLPRLVPQAVPDIFIRRSDAPRITNSLTPELIASRLTRLREGARFLASRKDQADLKRLWEAQYFVEAEYLLFNVDQPSVPIRLVLAEWMSSFAPSVKRRLLLRGYLSLAMATRDHAYLVLRMARRAVMLLLPAEFFPSSSDVSQPSAAPQVMENVEKMILHG